MSRNIGMLLCLACLGLLTLVSCTFIVRSQVEDLAGDGDSDAESDAAGEGTDADDAVEIPGPDFDTDTCGAWGRVYVGKHDRVDIDPEGLSDEMDGIGVLQLAVFFPKQYLQWWYVDAAAFPSGRPPIDFSVHEPFYYCIPPDFFTDPEHIIGDGWVTAIMYDIPTWEIDDSNNFLAYRSMIPDPVSMIISLQTAYPEQELFRSDSPLYWDGTMGQRIDVELARRVSRFTGSIQFTDFPHSTYGSRNGRVCVGVYGQRDEEAYLADRYPYEYLGSTWYDLENDDIEGPEATPFNFYVDFSGAKGQTYLVQVRYVEKRGFEDSYPCSLEEIEKGSCDSRCFRMGDRVGIETGRELFSIDPINGAGTADPACTLIPEDLCGDDIDL